MALYLVLLLIPVSGIGMYGHAYIKQALTQYLMEGYLDEIAIHAANIELKLGQVQQDVAYLNSGSTATAESRFAEFAAAHTLYEKIVSVDTSDPLMDSTYTDIAQVDTLRLVAQMQPLSIRLNPLVRADGTATLAVIAKLNEDLLVMEVETSDLLQGIRSQSPDYDWSLWFGGEAVLTTARAEIISNLDWETLSGTAGYTTVGDVFHVYHKIGTEQQWILAQTLPVALIQPDLSNYYTTFSILLIGGLVSVVGFALFAIARIIEPIYQLTQRVEGLRRGEVPASFPSPLPTDEFGTLMSAFDQMSVELEHQRRIERELVEQLITAQEEERKMLAYDLHDGLIQQLVGARFYLSQHRNAETAQGYDILTAAIAEGRRIIQGLHPTVLDDLGLEAALEECGNAMAQMGGWDMHIDLVNLDSQPDRVTNVTLFRVAQEALNNVFKHAQAANVWLTLHCEDDCLCLCVRDDGCGFDIDRVLDANTGWGIRTMQERAIMLHGTCTIRSHHQDGTTVYLTIPHQC